MTQNWKAFRNPSLGSMPDRLFQSCIPTPATILDCEQNRTAASVMFNYIWPSRLLWLPHPASAPHHRRDLHLRPVRLMQNFIEAQNIAKFKTRLQSETDPTVRAMLTLLLAEEEAKHALRIAHDKGRLI
jgi:hypothetical protein